MSAIDSLPAGVFCWVDLATTDPVGAVAFYQGLFGWEARDMPTDLGVPYTMLSRDGKVACALARMGPDQGATPYWSSYVRVADVDRSAERAVALGGVVLMPPMDVMDQGRLCFIRDPHGAALGLWQARAHQGAELEGAPGSRCWNELQTTDHAGAAAFYGGLFGWSARSSAGMMEGRYWLFEHEGAEIGGMLEIQDDWGPVPPNWAVYFCVEDCDGAIATAKRLGGSVVTEPMEVPGAGRFAFLVDPQGAVFAVIRPDH